MPPKKATPTKAAPKAAGKPIPAKPSVSGRVGGPKKPAPAALGAKKPGGPVPKGKASATKVTEKPKQKVWTKEDEAARKIQTKYRQYCAKKNLEKKKKEKQDYEELMDKLEREAYVQIVRMQQEEAERERQKEEEERRRKAEEKKRKKRLLEAAFDGDNDEIFTILKEVSEMDDKNGIGNDIIGQATRNRHLMAMIDCEDANENTPLSEAASGGHADTIKLLLDKGANPNTRGQFQRTPLYRAAFAGHLEASQILLQYGADPRIYGGDGQTPEQVASVDSVAEFIANWDLAQTEGLLQKLEAAKERRAEEDRQRREAEQEKLEELVQKAQKDYDSWQKQLDKAYCELNKRITEHDESKNLGFDRPDITLQTIHDAEGELEIIKMDFEKARDKLAGAKLRLREQMKQELDSDSAPDDLPGLKVMVRELDDVLLRDVGNRIQDSGKWPLLIDRSGQASTFLRYRDTNYINTIRPADMEPNKVRLALLGAIRYGKPFVLDMMEVDMFDTCVDRFDEIQKGLMGSLMDKSILENQKYLSLVKESDGDEYSKTKFNDFRAQNFKLFIVTKDPFPKDKLLEQTYPIRVFIPT